LTIHLFREGGWVEHHAQRIWHVTSNFLAMNFIRRMLFKRKAQGLKITKVDNSWVVMRGYSIIYIGSREMCESFVTQQSLAV